MRVAVLGGGNGSLAAAGDFALQGHEVALWRRDAEAVAAHVAQGSGIVVKDFNGRHEAQLALATTDMAAAVSGAELILCPAPAFAQEDIAKALAPHLVEGQVRCICRPQPSARSSSPAPCTRPATGRSVAFAEAGTLPWLARKHGPFEVAITIRAKRLPIGVFPLATWRPALGVIGRAFPGVIEPCGDALSGALMNAGPIIHPPLIVMNAGPTRALSSAGTSTRKAPKLRSAASPTRSMPSASPSARRSATAARTSRWPTTTRARAGVDVRPRLHDRLTDSGDWRETLVLTRHRYMREDVRSAYPAPSTASRGG